MAYRIYLFPVSVLALAAGFYFSYGKEIGPRWNRVVLWIVTGISAVLWSLPYLLSTMHRSATLPLDSGVPSLAILRISVPCPGVVQPLTFSLPCRFARLRRMKKM